MPVRRSGIRTATRSSCGSGLAPREGGLVEVAPLHALAVTMRTAFPSIRASIRTAVAHPTHPVKQPLCDPSYAFARTNSDGKAATRTYLGTEARTRGADRSFAMNDDRIEGNWKQFKGKVKEQWGKLTDDDLDVIAGRRG